MRKLSEKERVRNIKQALHSFQHNLARKKKARYKSSGLIRKKKIKYNYEIENFCRKNNVHKVKIKVQQALKLDSKTNLFDNPERVINLLIAILSNAKYHHSFPQMILNGRIKFGSLYLIDSICWEISSKRKWGIHFQNMHVNDHDILSKLRSFASSSYENDKAYLLNEKVPINRSGNPMANQQYKIKSKEITDLVVRGVRESSDPNFNLSDEAYQAISSTIGEHFDNILQHAPNAGFGYLCGFYDKVSKEVHILIYNFGKTIAETLSNANLPNEIRNQIDQVINNHTAKKFFGLLNNTFTKENALTLLSLQEGISSRTLYDKTRGHGLMDFIE